MPSHLTATEGLMDDLYEGTIAPYGTAAVGLMDDDDEVYYIQGLWMS